MSRLGLAAAVLIACAPALASPPALTEAQQLASVSTPFAVSREHITDDLYHYQFDLRVGSTPNARVRIHRVVRELSPWRPRPTSQAVMLLHGDFANFITNFVPSLGHPASSAPGLAPYLASRGIDAWGVDRRWTLPTTDGDISDLGEMGIHQAIGDTAVALAFARATRTLTDRDPGRIVLGGFSHGAQLTYAYAAADGRHISAIAALDIYYDIAPEDADLKALACANAAAERDALAQGVTDSSNSLFITAGQLARSAPEETSPLFSGYTNRGVALTLSGLTWWLAPYTPVYHLSAPIFDAEGNVTGLRESSEEDVTAWFASAPPHQSMLETAEFDEIWCGTTPRPELAKIRVPLFYLGAAGGFGDHGLYSTTKVSSTDITTHVVRRFGPERVAEDFGHGDLLYAKDAPTLAWGPLAAWLRRH
ncbi:alpha/beta hydrolase family protein [Cystobacter fuscus]|uniref:alpha/beta hydrolase family protein n=1 Tax=Cystobacter fuscus TaxID=43 RepID=UPI002B2A7997|nr:hypothetical protein F0U63_29410 [Cystobacter fuscus]